MASNMAPMRAVFITILLLVCGFTVLAEEQPSRTKELFEGVWLAWSPGQPYDVSDANYLIIWRVDDNYIFIRASTRWTTSGAGVLFPSDDPSDGRMLDGGDVLYELDENDTDILYSWFKKRDVVYKPDESDPHILYKWWFEERDTVAERTETTNVVSYRRFTSLNLDQLEAFWAELRELP